MPHLHNQDPPPPWIVIIMIYKYFHRHHQIIISPEYDIEPSAEFIGRKFHYHYHHISTFSSLRSDNNLAWIWYRAFCGVHKQVVSLFGGRSPQIATGGKRTTGGKRHIDKNCKEIYTRSNQSSITFICSNFVIFEFTFICEGRALDWQRYRNWESFHLEKMS